MCRIGWPGGRAIVPLMAVICAVAVSAVPAETTETVPVSDGKCLRFDGVDDVVNARDIDAIDSAQQLTAEMWVRIDEFTAWRTFFCKFRNLADRIQFQEYSEPGKIAVVVNNGADIEKEGNQAYYFTPDPEVTVGNWFHLAMVFDGTLSGEQRLKLYINGMLRTLKKEGAARGNVPDRLPATAAPLLLGAEKKGGEYGYKGLMDEIRIWTVARTADQIRDNMEHVLSGTEAGLQLYYPVDGESDVKKVLLDRTAGRHDGTLVNFNSDSCFIDRGVAQPTAAASMLTAKEQEPGQAQVSWIRGSGSANVVFVSESDTGFPRPQHGLTYSADPVFGRGSRIGETQWYCVYNGHEAQVQLTGLKPSKAYRVAVIDYNGAPGRERYKTDDTVPLLAVTSDAAPAAAPEKKRQEISFGLPETIAADVKTIVLNAHAESGLPVVYTSSNPGVADVRGDTLHISGPGKITVTATQSGDAAWEAADAAEVLNITDASPVPAQPDPPHPAGTAPRNLRPLLITGSAAIVTGTVVAILLLKNPNSKEAPVIDRPPGDPAANLIEP